MLHQMYGVLHYNVVEACTVNGLESGMGIRAGGGGGGLPPPGHLQVLLRRCLRAPCHFPTLCKKVKALP